MWLARSENYSPKDWMYGFLHEVDLGGRKSSPGCRLGPSPGGCLMVTSDWSQEVPGEALPGIFWQVPGEGTSPSICPLKLGADEALVVCEVWAPTPPLRPNLPRGPRELGRIQWDPPAGQTSREGPDRRHFRLCRPRLLRQLFSPAVLAKASRQHASS